MILVIRVTDGISEEALKRIAEKISNETSNKCSQMCILTETDLSLHKDNVTNAFEMVVKTCGNGTDEVMFANNFYKAIVSGAITKEITSLLIEELPKRKELSLHPAYNKVLLLCNLASGLMN